MLRWVCWSGFNTSSPSLYISEFPSSNSPSPVDKFHRLHRQRRGNDVIGVVSAPAHHDESVHLTGDEDEAPGADEAQQAGPHEGVLTDEPSAGAHWINLQARRCSAAVAMATSQH